MRKQINILLGTEMMDVFFKKKRFPGCNDLWEIIDRDKYQLYNALVGLDASASVIREGVDGASGLFLNAITDPDINPRLLQTLAEAFKNFPGHIINHPETIMKTGRDGVASCAAELSGWVSPGTIKIESEAAHKFPEIIENSGLKFPLIIRVAGAHGGKAALVSDQNDMQSMEKPPSGVSLYITEYHDYQSTDGYYRKLRVFLFSTGDIVARHLMISDDWNVSGPSSRPFMLKNQALQDEEAAFLRDANSILSAENIASLHALRAKLELDHMGVDCSILEDGKLLLFEAGAQMELANFGTEGGDFGYKIAAKQPLQDAFSNLLEKWST